MAKLIKFAVTAVACAVFSVSAFAAPKAEAKVETKSEVKRASKGQPESPNERSEKGEAQAREHSRADKPESSHGIGHGISKH